MIEIEKIQGAIFDVDDTLLDNRAELGLLHEISRYDAVKRVAAKYGIDALDTLTHDENLKAFLDAKSHSLAGAVWEILYKKGIVASEDLNSGHELLNEIVNLKNELHADVLRNNGKPVEGAAELVHLLAERHGLAGAMAVASSAIRRDIDIFFDEMTNLRQFFPAGRIVAYEDIAHGLGKPHPEPFDSAFKTLDLPDTARRNVLAFEDDPRGVASAKKAGLYVCAIATRFSSDDLASLSEAPDVVFDTYRDFTNLLQQK